MVHDPAALGVLRLTGELAPADRQVIAPVKLCIYAQLAQRLDDRDDKERKIKLLYGNLWKR